mmetsp:Transcript_7092/g.26076  ORF Transcript_7092/g.26076 Transcript_7092/m.26076 type:complete len:266 (+) Transcript_7092:494-1291(+)
MYVNDLASDVSCSSHLKSTYPTCLAPTPHTFANKTSPRAWVKSGPNSSQSSKTFPHVVEDIAPGLPPPNVQNASNTISTPGTLLGTLRPAFHPNFSFFFRSSFSTPNFETYCPVYVLLSSWNRAYSAFVPLQSGAARAICPPISSNVVPFSSATRTSIHRKSRNDNSFPPSATLAKMMSAPILFSLRSRRPHSFVSLPQTLMFMSWPFPPPKEQNCAYDSFRPAGTEFTAGATRPSFQCFLSRVDLAFSRPAMLAAAPVNVSLSS